MLIICRNKHTHEPGAINDPRLLPFVDADTLSSLVLRWFNSLLIPSLSLPFTPLRDLWLNGFASLSLHPSPKGVSSLHLRQNEDLFNLAETDTSTQAGGAIIQSVALRWCTVHTLSKHTQITRGPLSPDPFTFHSWQAPPFRSYRPN